LATGPLIVSGIALWQLCQYGRRSRAQSRAAWLDPLLAAAQL
jgi:hypothetical protein